MWESVIGEYQVYNPKAVVSVVTRRDFVYLPKPEYAADYPALIVELKWNRTAESALEQIKNRKYPESIVKYTGDILLVGINYDKASKEHTCVIEKLE